jgi:hypothetical protein
MSKTEKERLKGKRKKISNMPFLVKRAALKNFSN